MWVVWFDGLCEPRGSEGRLATYGFRAEHDGVVVGEGGGLVAGPGGPLATAHVAEFGALVQALAWARAHKRDDEPLVVRGDSRLAIETTAGRWDLASPTLLPLRDAAQALAREVGVARFEKVSREENAEADRLSREAYHALADAHPEWGLGRWAKGATRRRGRASNL